MVQIYTIDGEFIIDSEILHECKDFFRKMIYKNRTREKKLCKLLMKHPHKNIVQIYGVDKGNKGFIDMELLKTDMSNVVLSKVKNVMIEVKTYLQTLGIMYIDWKLDNIGISEDGQFKLFDFDGSGLINVETKEWIIEPPKSWWSYNKAVQNGMEKPVDIDNYAFDLEFNKNIYI